MSDDYSDVAPAVAAAGLGVGAVIAISLCGGVLPLLLCCWCCYRCCCRSDRVVVVNNNAGGGGPTMVNVTVPQVAPAVCPPQQGYAPPPYNPRADNLASELPSPVWGKGEGEEEAIPYCQAQRPGY
ncbi:uncharacterized protein LOC134534290 isoform X2 [Bacillus rossius redtenbacheri]|uniref:uncharacterized protein LOC134534290 isoform X2 n=1 Tax=Bacillus rossius redtenbacheri TaxID=93214 RepID=UPI002FDD874F